VGARVGEEMFGRNGISGPLFLFFGWYGRTAKVGGEYEFLMPGKKYGAHALFGWLQVARKVNFTGRDEREAFQRDSPWAAAHPRVACSHFEGRSNAIYIAPKPDSEEDRLVLDGKNTGLRASGMFSTFEPEIHTLTLQDAKTKRDWRLPSWFYRDGQPTLGMHGKLWRWNELEEEPDHVRLQSVDKGQEFVFDSRDYDPNLVRIWITTIVEAGQGRL
jgi:hypothetical protein